jgi:hypothetical protein
MYNNFDEYINELRKMSYSNYKHYLQTRLENLKKIVNNGDHAVVENIRKEYWGCICADEDINTSICDNCYGINLIRKDVFNKEIKALSELLDSL